MTAFTVGVSSSPQQIAELPDVKIAEENQSAAAREGEFRLGYRPSLDGIRGLFMLVVMICHAQLKFIPGGKLSMSVFFVLSGFLITALLMQEWKRTGKISFKQFYYRRALRILPALFALLLVCSLYALTQERNDAIASFKSIAATLFYVANWYIALNIGNSGPLTHTWSLSVEEQFYTVLPIFLTVLLCLKLKKRWMIGLLILLTAAAIIHTVSLWEGDASIRRIYFGTDARIDQFLMGCLIGVLASWNILPKTRQTILASKIAAIASVIFIVFLELTLYEADPFMSRGATTLIGIASAAIIINLISSPVKPLKDFLETPLLVWIGRISYGLYLWHFPIFRQIMALGLHPVLTIIIEVAITFAVAILSYYFIEQPFLRLKNRSGKTVREAIIPAI